MFEGLPICRSGGNPAAEDFLKWQRDMRGALSALPTASGPWIWLPPKEVTPIEQMSFL